MTRVPTYLRTVVTAACPLACPYCHMEGDPHQKGSPMGLDAKTIGDCLEVAVAAGVRKFKFLGGEPLVRRDLPVIIARLRRAAPTADISVITAGAVPLRHVEACFAAGLDRMNMSIHGWTPEAAARRGCAGRKYAMREDVLRYLVTSGRPTKLNYVYTGPDDDADLAGLLEWAAGMPVVVNVLDDLGDDTTGPQTLLEMLMRLRGSDFVVRPEPDPDSLPTSRLYYSDGLVVEVKTSHLGDVAPWSACDGCPARSRCREGIFALRLTHDGRLQTCMDRPDLSFPLRGWAADGPELATKRWNEAMEGLLR